VRLVTIIFIIIAFSYAAILAGPFDDMEYQSESVATSGFVTSGLANPAGLAFFGAMGLRYTHSYTDSSYKGDDGLFISSRKGFFSAQWLNHTTGIFRRKFTLGMGERLAANLYAGVTYSWFTGANELYRKKKDWKFGMLYHPFPTISVGLTADHLNEPEFGTLRQKRLYRPGTAFRFLRDRLTVSADGRWLEGDDLDKINGNIRLGLGLSKQAFFTCEYRTEGMFLFGITYDFDQTKIGAQARTRSGDAFDGGSYFLDFGAVKYNPYPGSGNIGFLKIGSDITEEPRAKSLFSKPQRTVLSTIKALRKGAELENLDGLLIKIDGVNLPMAAVQEIRQSILEYRKNGKNVTIYLDSGSNLSYYLASVANKIIMKPNGYLDLRGLSITATFYKEAMDKLGIEAQVISTGPHKTYGDVYTKSGLTEQAREQIDWILDDVYDQFVSDISIGRGIHSVKTRELIDNGPYTARDAFETGLIDGLIYYDELIGESHDGHFENLLDLYTFFETPDYNSRWSEPKKIAIVYATGSIKPGKSGYSFLDGRTLGSSTLAKALKKVRNQNDVKAVVLRVNSPGGDFFASNEIYREIELLKGKKPIVVSMSGVAASGGYYISCSGDEIMASPSSITGSIGVVVGKPDLSRLYDKIGVGKETVKRGEHADIRSFSRPSTDDEMQLVENQIWQYYDDFVSKVSSWRKMGVDSVDAIAGGRVWTGRQAKKIGLIDSFGGIWDAIDLARQKAEIDSEDQLLLEIYPRYGYKLYDFSSPFSIGAEIAELFDSESNGLFSLRLPFDLEIK